MWLLKYFIGKNISNGKRPMKREVMLRPVISKTNRKKNHGKPDRKTKRRHSWSHGYRYHKVGNHYIAKSNNRNSNKIKSVNYANKGIQYDSKRRSRKFNKSENIAGNYELANILMERIIKREHGQHPDKSSSMDYPDYLQSWRTLSERLALLNAANYDNATMQSLIRTLTMPAGPIHQSSKFAKCGGLITAAGLDREAKPTMKNDNMCSGQLVKIDTKVNSHNKSVKREPNSTRRIHKVNDLGKDNLLPTKQTLTSYPAYSVHAENRVPDEMQNEPSTAEFNFKNRLVLNRMPNNGYAKSRNCNFTIRGSNYRGTFNVMLDPMLDNVIYNAMKDLDRYNTNGRTAERRYTSKSRRMDRNNHEEVVTRSWCTMLKSLFTSCGMMDVASGESTIWTNTYSVVVDKDQNVCEQCKGMVNVTLFEKKQSDNRRGKVVANIRCEHLNGELSKRSDSLDAAVCDCCDDSDMNKKKKNEKKEQELKNKKKEKELEEKQSEIKKDSEKIAEPNLTMTHDQATQTSVYENHLVEDKFPEIVSSDVGLNSTISNENNTKKSGTNVVDSKEIVTDARTTLIVNEPAIEINGRKIHVFRRPYTPLENTSVLRKLTTYHDSGEKTDLKLPEGVRLISPFKVTRVEKDTTHNGEKIDVTLDSGQTVSVITKGTVRKPLEKYRAAKETKRVFTEHRRHTNTPSAQGPARKNVGYLAFTPKPPRNVSTVLCTCPYEYADEKQPIANSPESKHFKSDNKNDATNVQNFFLTTSLNTSDALYLQQRNPEIYVVNRSQIINAMFMERRPIVTSKSDMGKSGRSVPKKSSVVFSNFSQSTTNVVRENFSISSQSRQVYMAKDVTTSTSQQTVRNSGNYLKLISTKKQQSPIENTYKENYWKNLPKKNESLKGALKLNIKKNVKDLNKSKNIRRNKLKLETKLKRIQAVKERQLIGRTGDYSRTISMINRMSSTVRKISTDEDVPAFSSSGSSENSDGNSSSITVIRADKPKNVVERSKRSN